jgi:hypothetical protein
LTLDEALDGDLRLSTTAVTADADTDAVSAGLLLVSRFGRAPGMLSEVGF